MIARGRAVLIPCYGRDRRQTTILPPGTDFPFVPLLRPILTQFPPKIEFLGTKRDHITHFFVVNLYDRVLFFLNTFCLVENLGGGEGVFFFSRARGEGGGWTICYGIMCCCGIVCSVWFGLFPARIPYGTADFVGITPVVKLRDFFFGGGLFFLTTLYRPDKVTYSTLIHGLSKAGDNDGAWEVRRGCLRRLHWYWCIVISMMSLEQHAAAVAHRQCVRVWLTIPSSFHLAANFSESFCISKVFISVLGNLRKLKQFFFFLQISI